MIANGSTPARRAAKRECALMRLMDDLAAEERTEDFNGCREALAVVSAMRHALATAEHRDARAVAA